MNLSGAVYLFSSITADSNNQWSQVAKLVASNGIVNDYFGNSISIYNNVIVVGAIGDNSYSGNQNNISKA